MNSPMIAKTVKTPNMKAQKSRVRLIAVAFFRYNASKWKNTIMKAKKISKKIHHSVRAGKVIIMMAITIAIASHPQIFDLVRETIFFID